MQITHVSNSVKFNMNANIPLYAKFSPGLDQFQIVFSVFANFARNRED